MENTLGSFGHGDVWETKIGAPVRLEGGPYDGREARFEPSKYLHVFDSTGTTPDAAYKWDLEFTNDMPPRLVVRTASFLGFCDKYGEPLSETPQKATDARCDLVGAEPPACQLHEGACTPADHPANPGGDIDPNG